LNLGLDHAIRVIIAICVFEDTLLPSIQLVRCKVISDFSIADFRLVVMMIDRCDLKSSSEIALAFER
jgi:hypothetical protein